MPHEPASGGRWKNMPHGHREHVPASRVPASGGEHVPLVLASGGSGKLVTFVLHHPRARDARGRKLSFLEFCPPFR